CAAPPYPACPGANLLAVGPHRPLKGPEFPCGRPPRPCRSFRHVSPRRDRHLRNERRQSLLRQSSRTCPPGVESPRIQSARRQHSHLFQALRFLRSLPARKRHLRRRSSSLHLRIRQAPPRRKTLVAPTRFAPRLSCSSGFTPPSFFDFWFSDCCMVRFPALASVPALFAPHTHNF